MSQVLRQVEYYFCDENLRTDSFMRGKIDASAEGYVDLPLIMTFNRIRCVVPVAKIGL